MSAHIAVRSDDGQCDVSEVLTTNHFAVNSSYSQSLCLFLSLYLVFGGYTILLRFSIVDAHTHKHSNDQNDPI